MNSRKLTARIAGLIYLVVVLTGMFSLLYVPATLFVEGDAQQTLNNIISGERLFRLGVVASVVCYVAFILLPLVLYKLLGEVNRTHAFAMVALAIVSVPISLYNLTHKFAVLTLIENSTQLQKTNGFDLASQVFLSLQAYENGITLVSVFWGLWLFPFGYLVFRSGFLPKFFGVFLIAGCFGYIINFIGGFLFPVYSALGVASIISLPSAIGEIGICFWLLIAGAKEV